MSLPTIDPIQARQLLEQGATLVDIREPDEHARARIPGARHVPLSQLDDADFALHEGRPVIFHCRSGARTQGQAQRLAGKAGDCKAYLLAGGLDGWRAAGLPVAVDRRAPIELQRQVQLGAGALVLIGTLLGALVSPWFLAVPLFVGAGLATAGATGFCGLAQLLAKAPWNRASLAGDTALSR